MYRAFFFIIFYKKYYLIKTYLKQSKLSVIKIKGINFIIEIFMSQQVNKRAKKKYILNCRPCSNIFYSKSPFHYFYLFTNYLACFFGFFFGGGGYVFIFIYFECLIKVGLPGS